MPNGQLCRLQRLMLIDEVRPLTEAERAEFDDLWAMAEAEIDAEEVNDDDCN